MVHVHTDTCWVKKKKESVEERPRVREEGRKEGRRAGTDGD